MKKKHGAIGSRLTGAGWGGCCVSMVKSDNVQDLIEKIWNEFYSTRIKDEKKEDLIFESSASIGAGIEQLKKDWEENDNIIFISFILTSIIILFLLIYLKNLIVTFQNEK